MIARSFVILMILAFTLKNKACEYYNVIVDVPRTCLQLVHPDKTSHSKENWNDKVKAGLVRSSFDSDYYLL